jgi:hypothetical protein
LAVELAMSPSEVHSAIKRALRADLAFKKGDKIFPSIRNVEEFIVSGVRYAFVPDLGELTRGMPTAYAAPPLKKSIVSGKEPPPVWPDDKGKVRGVSFSPLYKSAPRASRNDPELYELLSLLDSIRLGRARERNMAIREIKKRFKQYG